MRGGSSTDVASPHPGGSEDDEAEDLRLLVESSHDFAMFVMDPERCIVRWSAGAEHLTGWSETEVLGQSGDIIFTPEDRAAGAPQQEQDTALAEGRAADERWHVRKDGSIFSGSGVLTALYRVDTGELRGFGKVMQIIPNRSGHRTRCGKMSSCCAT